MNSLNEDNQAQLQKYLRFFRQKRDGIQRALQDEFRDAKADKADEEVFTKDDVMDMLDSIGNKVRSNVGFEISNIVNMSALVVTQLLESAELRGVQLELDTAAVENQALLEAIDKIALSGPVVKARAGELTSFRDESRARQQEAKAMRDEADRLDSANKSLQERFVMAQSDATRLTRERNALADDVAELKRKLESYERREVVESKEADDSRLTIRSLREQLDEAREEMERKVQDTTQFRQMRQLMQSQSSKITDLRRRLQRYEPDEGKEEADD